MASHLCGRELALAEVSVDHWISLPSQLTGFSRPAVSTMNSHFAQWSTGADAVVRQQAAYSNVTFVLDTWILPNTMYAEGTYAPCGETPPAVASAIQDWMLLSTPDMMTVFPGIDDGNVVDEAFHLVRPALNHCECDDARSSGRRAHSWCRRSA